MTHTSREKQKLLNRASRIRGQAEAVEKAIAADKECVEVLHVIVALRGALHGLMAEVIDEHIRFHIVNPDEARRSKRALAAQELIDVLKSYLR